mmetsp:Transcript_5555/g.12805  ORF Transcript_5555/g.12805 Transcript_5555/m.12805 type:complete len:261 (+) Transcript_5555:2356-3138(+)
MVNVPPRLLHILARHLFLLFLVGLILFQPLHVREDLNPLLLRLGQLRPVLPQLALGLPSRRFSPCFLGFIRIPLQPLDLGLDLFLVLLDACDLVLLILHQLLLLLDRKRNRLALLLGIVCLRFALDFGLELVEPLHELILLLLLLLIGRQSLRDSVLQLQHFTPDVLELCFGLAHVRPDELHVEGVDLLLHLAEVLCLLVVLFGGLVVCLEPRGVLLLDGLKLCLNLLVGPLQLRDSVMQVRQSRGPVEELVVLVLLARV